MVAVRFGLLVAEGGERRTPRGTDFERDGVPAGFAGETGLRERVRDRALLGDLGLAVVVGGSVRRADLLRWRVMMGSIGAIFADSEMARLRERPRPRVGADSSGFSGVVGFGVRARRRLSVNFFDSRVSCLARDADRVRARIGTGSGSEVDASRTFSADIGGSLGGSGSLSGIGLGRFRLETFVN